MCSQADDPSMHETEYAAAAVPWTQREMTPRPGDHTRFSTGRPSHDTIAAGRREATTERGTGRAATGEARPAPAWSFAVALVLFAIVAVLLALFAATEGVG